MEGGVDSPVHILHVTNSYDEVELDLIKTDADAGTSVPVKGAEYQLYNDTDTIDVNTGKVIKAGTLLWQGKTDAGGKIQVTEINQGAYKGHKLSNGRYHFVEVSAAEGYALSDAIITADATWNNGKHREEVVVTASDKRQRVEMSLVKKDSLTKEPVEGAAYKLINDNDIIDINTHETIPAGTVLYMGRTDKNGEIVTDKINTGKYTGHDLPNGTYHFEEYSAAYQYALKDAKIEVNADWKKDGRGKLVVSRKKTTDDRQTVGLELQKKDKETGKNVGQNEYVTLQGAEFDLFVTSVDTRVIETGKVIPTGTKVGHYKTDENGQIIITEMNEGKYAGKLLPNGTYEFVETAAPTGYVLDTTPVVVDASYVQDLKHIDVASECEEQIIRQQVAVQKHSDEKGNGEVVLEGIGFQFYLVSDVLEANGMKDDSYLPWDENTIKQKGYYGLDAEKFSTLIENVGSIIFFVGLTLPRYRFSMPYASLDMNLRQCIG